MVHEINSLRQPGAQCCCGTDGSGWYSRWPSLSPVGGHPAFKPWCKCLRCQDANEIANKIVNFQNKKDFCIGTGTCRRAGGRDGARTSPAAPQGFTPRAALGNLTERHPCCCKRLLNLFIKNCKASATNHYSWPTAFSKRHQRELVSDVSAQFPEMALEARDGQSFLYSQAAMHKELKVSIIEL